MAEILFSIDFLQFIILMFIYGVMAPFFAWGLYKFYTFITTIMKVRSGHIRVWKQLPNDQIIKFWARPAGGKISFKSRNPSGITDKTTITTKLQRGWLWREGGIPFIKLDKDNNQVQWEANTVQTDIPKEVVDELADTAYAAGLMAGIKDKGTVNKLIWLMSIMMIVIAVIALMNYYFWANPNIHVTTQTVQIVGENVTQKVV